MERGKPLDSDNTPARRASAAAAALPMTPRPMMAISKQDIGSYFLGPQLYREN